MPSVQPYSIAVPDQVLERIRARVADYQWHEMPDDGGWAYGANLDYMRELCAYWLEEFDWRAQETALNRLPQFTAKVDGLDIHFIHEKGSGPAPMPLVISHGWPGSVSEFVDIIEPLAHPERFGGSVDDAFDVVAPSLPGFAFSGKPARPIGPRRIAGMFADLMREQLGYDGFLAQGGDWGSAISTWLGYDHAMLCRGVHINMLPVRDPGGPQGPEEEAWAAECERVLEAEAGYNHQQSTKPQTLSYAMMDSPVGVAAWIVEKFNTWSDTQGDDIESVYSKDQLLTNIMVYLVSESFNTATWIYYGRRQEGGREMPPGGKRVEVPTAAALFPAEFILWPPRSYAERLFDLRSWTEMPRGGHFAALEEPELLAEDIRVFARSLR
ncbi:MAG: alpha/beta fold hydrolase [Alphaproteobacteria bacterium]|jgi:microsomal epoxide hydrolase|nr:epoxide hydrolase [Rhodospirillaceae bacterium]MDP6407438.1 alpha/beta fold hydrolase [Alphaproteobacteria bacterium]MDP6624045.1 alpha/beta fold hydrolase [Alphaproteobacteria bacterium]